jgi:putative MATE family efflux protein
MKEGFTKKSKNIFKIAIPVMMQNLVGYLFISTDMAFISRYKPEGLSALSSVTAPYFVLLSFMFAIGQGITVLVSKSIGAKKKELGSRVAENAIFMMQILSFVYFFFWLFMGGKIVELMGAKGEVLTIGREYIYILSFIFLTMGTGIAASATFNGLGRTVPVMIISISKLLLNIFLNWLLIFGNWGFPELGVAGSAMGTVISEIAGNIALFILILNTSKLNVRIMGILRPSVKIIQRIVKVGVPVGIEYIMWSTGNALLIIILNSINSMAAGYFGLLNTLTNLSANIYNGICVAALVMVAKAAGENNKKEIMTVSKITLGYALLICFLIGIIFAAIPEKIISIFAKNGQNISYLAGMLFIVFLISIPKAVNIMGGGFIRGTGNTKWMMYTQFFGVIVHIPTAWFLAIFLNMGLTGILIAVFLDELLRGAVNYGKFLYSQRVKIKIES